jgi:hypothetical protein
MPGRGEIKHQDWGRGGSGGQVQGEGLWSEFPVPIHHSQGQDEPPAGSSQEGSHWQACRVLLA